MNTQQKVYSHLDAMNIAYTVSEHPPVYTVEEMEQLGLNKLGCIVKNLFLCDGGGKRHFLVLAHPDKAVNLKELQAKIGSSRLRFASTERLEKYLGLEKGAVSPMGLLNDVDQAVEVVVDTKLLEQKTLGVHPNDNTATIWLEYDDLERVVRENGNDLAFVTL